MQERVAVLSWPSVPIEIVRAAGLRPEIARASAGPTPAADPHLESGVFPKRLQHLIDAALTARLTHAACIVIPRTSDVDYKCFLYLREFARRGMAPGLPPVILFDLLQSPGASVREYDVGRTQALYGQLAAVSGRIPSADDLVREITRANAARAAARRLVALRRGNPRATGTEVFPLLAAFWQMDPDRYVAMAIEAASDIATRRPLTGPRVMLTGAPVESPVLHAAIESLGAIVTAEIGPWGNDATGEDVRVDNEPVAAIADKYRVDTMGARTPASTLAHWTERMLDEVDAVVVSLPPDDAVFGWDYPALRDRLDAKGIPHVCLRGDPNEPLSLTEHARLDAMVAQAARLETRDG